MRSHVLQGKAPKLFGLGGLLPRRSEAVLNYRFYLCVKLITFDIDIDILSFTIIQNFKQYESQYGINVK